MISKHSGQTLLEVSKKTSSASVEWDFISSFSPLNYSALLKPGFINYKIYH
jgi:hypothetical protein